MEEDERKERRKINSPHQNERSSPIHRRFQSIDLRILRRPVGGGKRRIEEEEKESSREVDSEYDKSVNASESQINSFQIDRRLRNPERFLLQKRSLLRSHLSLRTLLFLRQRNEKSHPTFPLNVLSI